MNYLQEARLEEGRQGEAGRQSCGRCGSGGRVGERNFVFIVSIQHMGIQITLGQVAATTPLVVIPVIQETSDHTLPTMSSHLPATSMCTHIHTPH